MEQGFPLSYCFAEPLPGEVGCRSRRALRKEFKRLSIAQTHSFEKISTSFKLPSLVHSGERLLGQMGHTHGDHLLKTVFHLRTDKKSEEQVIATMARLKAAR